MVLNEAAANFPDVYAPSISVEDMIAFIQAHAPVEFVRSRKLNGSPREVAGRVKRGRVVRAYLRMIEPLKAAHGAAATACACACHAG